MHDGLQFKIHLLDILVYSNAKKYTHCEHTQCTYAQICHDTPILTVRPAFWPTKLVSVFLLISIPYNLNNKEQG